MRVNEEGALSTKRVRSAIVKRNMLARYFHSAVRPRDDLRTPQQRVRASASGREGAEWLVSAARTAQMITPTTNRLGVCAGEKDSHSLRSGEALARVSWDIQRRFGDLQRKPFERTAVIARCGIRHRAARRSGGQGNKAR
jgi:hypothetical protein